jgi:hypothetical protein
MQCRSIDIPDACDAIALTIFAIASENCARYLDSAFQASSPKRTTGSLLAALFFVRRGMVRRFAPSALCRHGGGEALRNPSKSSKLGSYAAPAPASERLMSIYHINIRTESHIAATVDVEMENLTDLRVEMARFVGELLKDHAALIWADQDWQVDVTDTTGLILYVLHISAADTPATAGSLKKS